MSRGRPLLDFEQESGIAPPLPPPPSYAAAHDDEEEKDAPPRRWFHYAPTAGKYTRRCRRNTRRWRADYWYHLLWCLVTFLFLLAPQPSWLIVLVNYHLRILRDPWLFARHLGVSYTLTILAFCSLTTILLRDPGRPNANRDEAGSAEDDVHITQALLADDFDFSSPGKFCRKCWAPKPPRTHQ